VHFMPDSSVLGCQVRGPHLHVRKRENVDGAAARSRRPRAVPVDWMLVQAFDHYMLERNACAAA
jgi:integrase/recombinase XerD